MEYMATYGKSYSTEAEYSYRKAIFLQKKAFIDAQNQLESLATFGFNKFSDWSQEEYDKIVGKSRPVDKSRPVS